jgi:Flp pilus assembly protein TadG
MLVDDHGNGSLVRPRDRRRPGEAGQSLLEFAFVLPVIVLLVAAFIEIGRAVHAYNTISNAARQGVRVAIVNQIDLPTECDQSRPIEDPSDADWSIKGCALTAASSHGIDVNDVTISYFPPPGTTLSCSPTLHVGCMASVTVVYHFTLATPFVANVVGPMTMTATSEMPIERVFP